MLKRILSTLALWSLVITVVVIGKITAGIWILAVLTFLTQLEFYRLLKKMGHAPNMALGLLFGSLIMLGSWYGPKAGFFNPLDASVAIFCLSVVCMSLYLLTHPSQPSMNNPLMPTVFGILYVPFMLQFYVLIQVHFTIQGASLQGLLLCIWLIMVAKFTDVGGLLVGTYLGRHKMAPHISPCKTWEGALGGIVTAVLVGCILYVVGASWLPSNFTFAKAFLIAIPISGVSILSDLVQSVLKRQAGSKDSGYMIPGIGGAFDLMDSLILTAPLGYYLLKATIY